MMPANEVELRRTYKDQYGLKITIEAGCTGWSVLWADGGADYKTHRDTTENNFQAALEYVKSNKFELTDINTDKKDICN